MPAFVLGSLLLCIDRDSERVKVAVVAMQGLDHDDLACRRDVRPRAFALRKIVVARISDAFLEFVRVDRPAVNSVENGHAYSSSFLPQIGQNFISIFKKKSLLLGVKLCLR